MAAKADEATACAQQPMPSVVLRRVLRLLNKIPESEMLVCLDSKLAVNPILLRAPEITYQTQYGKCLKGSKGREVAGRDDFDQRPEIGHS